MIIELHVPDGAVSNQVIVSLKEDLTSLSKITKDIARAEIMLRYDGTALKDDKICEIKLVLLDDYLFVQKRNGRFVRSANEAVEDLKTQLLERVKTQNDLSDQKVDVVRH